MIRDIQERRIETELELLQESIIPTKYKKISKDEYYIDVYVPFSLIEHENIKSDINFLIHMQPNFPFSQPRVYCKSQFSYPHISDGRDVLEDVLGQGWTPAIKIIDIIDRLPEFIKQFIRNLQEGVLVLVGNYHLGEKYDLAFLESLNIYVKKVKEKLIIDGKEKEIPKILLVSDIFFCLFDQEKWSKNNLHLTFWSNIRSLVTIKKLIKGDTCRFFWKQKNKNKNLEMVLTVENSNSNDLVNLLLDKMSKFGINYKVSKHNMGPKQGVIPPIDIDEVERSILEFETKAEISPDLEVMQYLMTLYEKAVEYYSATNNPRWELYTEKIHSTLKSPRVRDFLDKDENKPKNIPQPVLESESIPKEKRITHVVKEDPLEEKNKLHPITEKILSNVLDTQQMQQEKLKEKENQNLSSSTSTSTTIESNLNEQTGEVEKKIEEIEKIEGKHKVKDVQQKEDLNFKNEQTGLKIEISHDEDQQIDYSDEEDEEDQEQDLSDQEKNESEKK